MYNSGALYHSEEETYAIVNDDPLYFVRFSDAYCSMIHDACLNFILNSSLATSAVKDTVFDAMFSLFVSLAEGAETTGHPASHKKMWSYLQQIVDAAHQDPHEFTEKISAWRQSAQRKALDATVDSLAIKSKWEDREATYVYLYLQMNEAPSS